MRFGIQTLAREFFGSAPDFVVSGPNVGSEIAHNLAIDARLTRLLVRQPWNSNTKLRDSVRITTYSHSLTQTER